MFSFTNTRSNWFHAVSALLAVPLLFFLLRDCGIDGGDTGVFLDAAEYGDGEPPAWIYRSREPLTYLLAQFFYRHLIWDIRAAYALLGAICGGLWLAILLHFSTDRRFLAVNVCSATLMQFIGHVEMYAPVSAALTWYFIELARAAGSVPRRGPARAVLALGLAALFHKVALVFSPALLWLLLERDGGRLRPLRLPALHWVAVFVALFFPFILDSAVYAMYLNSMGSITPKDENSNILRLVTPLNMSMADAVWAGSAVGTAIQYTLATPAHWSHFFFFIVIGAPLAIPALILFRRRLRFPYPPLAPLATASLLGLGWMFLWHPARGYRDWDLFILGVLPLNILAGALGAGLFSPTVGNIPLSDPQPENQL